jgi:hypothetical protein
VGELSCRDGHVYVFEHSEQHPLLLSNVAMGARRALWYRKRSPSDVAPPSALAAAKGAEILLLEPQAESPFLANIALGARQMVFETKLARSPMWEHPPQATDFLLVRRPRGDMYLRAMWRTAVIGHQEPHPEGRVPYPVRERETPLLEYQQRRLEVYIWRKLRALRTVGRPEVLSMMEMRTDFPWNWDHATVLDKLVKRLLRPTTQVKGCQTWERQPLAEIPSEATLRQLMSPEAVCAHEAMLAGIERLKAIGVGLLTLTNPKTSLATAINVLSREPEKRTLCAMLKLELSLMPWQQTHAFLHSLDGKVFLQLDGSRQGAQRRGHYIHWTKKAHRGGELDERKQRQLSIQPKKIGGTDADMRRLGLADTAAELRRLGVLDSEIAVMTRWDRIRLIRELSESACADGGRSREMHARYVRVEKENNAQLQKGARETATKLLERMERMFGANARDLDPDEVDEDAAAAEDEYDSDVEDLAGEFETALVAQAVAGRAAEAAKRHAQAEKEREEKADEVRQMAALRTIFDESAPAPAAGRRRLRKVVTNNHTDGRVERREELITDEAVLGAFDAAKAAGGDAGAVRDAVLSAQGALGFPALPFNLQDKPAELSPEEQLKEAKKRERVEKEHVKKAARNAVYSRQRFEKIKGAMAEHGALNATVMQDNDRRAPGGVLVAEEGTLKLKMLQRAGLQIGAALEENAARKRKPGRGRGRGRGRAAAAEEPETRKRRRSSADGAGRGFGKRAKQDHVPASVNERATTIAAALAAGNRYELAKFAVNDVLLGCLERVTGATPAFEAAFGQGVNFDKPSQRHFVADYLSYVPRANARYLQRMRVRLRTVDRRYESAAKFLEDIAMLAASARAYHAPPDGRPPGAQAVPELAQLADDLEAAVRAEVAGAAEALERARRGPDWPQYEQFREDAPAPGGGMEEEDVFGSLGELGLDWKEDPALIGGDDWLPTQF